MNFFRSCYHGTYRAVRIFSAVSSLALAGVMYEIVNQPVFGKDLLTDYYFGWLALAYIFLQWARISMRNVFDGGEFAVDALTSFVPVFYGLLVLVGPFILDVRETRVLSHEIRTEIAFLLAASIVDLVCGLLQGIAMLQAPFKREELKSRA